MPPGVNMDMGKGYDDNDQLRRSSLSQHLMWQERRPNLVLIVSSLFPHITFLMDSLCISSQLYIQRRYTLVFLHFTTYINPFYFLKSLPKCNLSSSLRSLHLVKRRQAHLAREVQQDEPTDKTRQHYLLKNRTCVARSYKE